MGQPGRHDPAAAIRRGQRDLPTELVTLAGLAFAGALHLRLMPTVELLRIVWLLVEDSFGLLQHGRQVFAYRAGFPPNVPDQTPDVGAQLA